MLQFKQRQPEQEELPQRWDIGIDRRHAIAYVALALVAGFAAGFIVSRYTARKEATPTFIADNRPAPRPAPVDPAAGDYHRVTKVIRADAIEVDGEGPVRMIGIETPDGKSPKEIYGVHGQRALSFIEKTLLNQDVRLEPDGLSLAKDDAGNTLAYVYLRDGTMVNGEMVKQGLAFVRGTDQFRMANDFRGFEHEAMLSMRGVWGSSSSSSSTQAVATPPSTTTAPPDEKKKVSPLPPSAFGANIPALSGTSSSAPTEMTVWVSASDKLYHKSGCEFLDAKKKRSLSLSQAKSEGFTACSRCYASTVLKAP